MSKKFLFGLIVGLVIVADALLWLLSALNVAGMEWFSLGWAAVIAAGVLGIAFIGRGLFGKTAGPLKKMWIYFGAAFLVVAVVELQCTCIPIMKMDVFRHFNHIEGIDMTIVEPGIQPVGMNHAHVTRPLLVVVILRLVPPMLLRRIFAERGIGNTDESRDPAAYLCDT